MLSWKKLGIEIKIALPVLGPFPTKEDVCGYGVAIKMVSKSLSYRNYGGYTQYDSIRKFRNAHTNSYGESVEGAMNSRYICKIHSVRGSI